MVKLIKALTCQEDRAMLESNLSAWRGSAGDNGGWLLAALILFKIRIPVENQSGKLIYPAIVLGSNRSLKWMANCEIQLFHSLTGMVHFLAASMVAR